MLPQPFKQKKADFEKLLCFGFIQNNGVYSYSTKIADGQFKLTVFVSSDGNVKTKVIDDDFGEEYILHLTTETGAFVGKVREDYQAVLQNISEQCFETDVFDNEQARKTIRYVKEKYNDQPEFLWSKFPQNAILRRKDNNKWYAVFLTVSKRKLGLDADEEINIIDLRATPEQIVEITDYQKYFPGYHMNKKHWLTICFDNSVPTEEIYQMIDTSYMLAKK